MSHGFKVARMADLPAEWRAVDSPQMLAAVARQLGREPGSVGARVVFCVPEHPAVLA